jgi:hypothetical protein
MASGRARSRSGIAATSSTRKAVSAFLSRANANQLANASRWVPIASEAAIVRRVFDAYASGNASLRSAGNVAPGRVPGLRQWSATMIHLMLSNRVYVGDIVSGPNCSDAVGYGKRDAHPALIDRELFERVQTRLNANAKLTRAPARAWALSGLVSCSQCGQPYIAGGTWGTDEKTRVPFYTERRNKYEPNAGQCDGKMGCVYKHVLEGTVIRVVHNILSQPDVRERIAQAVDRYLAGSGQAIEATRAQLTSELERAEKSQERLLNAVATGVLTSDEVASRVKAFRERAEELTARIQRLAFQERQEDVAYSIRNQLIEMASDFGASAKQVSGGELRELLAPWLQSARFDKIKRKLTVEVRTIPAVNPLVLSPLGWPSGQDQRDTVVRTVTISRKRSA